MLDSYRLKKSFALSVAKIDVFMSTEIENKLVKKVTGYGLKKYSN